MAYCFRCGSPLPDENSRFCTACGAEQKPSQTSAKQAQRGSAPVFIEAPPGLDKRTFFKLYSPGAKKCFGAGVLGYVCAGITAVLALSSIVPEVGIYALLDAAITLVLSLLVHLLKSRVAATLLFAYAIVSMLIMLISNGMFSGWLVALAGVWGMIGSFAAAKEWQMYQLRSQNAAAVNMNGPTPL